MKPKRSLPILLVSACNKVIAEEFISELIDNEVTEGVEGEKGGGQQIKVGRVWRLVNKYYSADVLVLALGDSDKLAHMVGQGARLEAHVAYFTSEECEAADETAVACAERRARTVAAVRVAALRSEREGVLGAWAARARYEPVPLQHPDEGVARVRDALHAHPWPGLRRLDSTGSVVPFRDLDYSSSSGEEDDDDNDDIDDIDDGDEGDVERAEQFALALGALGDMGRAGGAGAAALGDAERRERAEQLLAAFCRALGQPLDQ